MSQPIHEKLVNPVKAAFAAAVFTAAVTLTGCGASTGAGAPACPPQPTKGQMDAMSDTKLRECLESADREGHGSYGHYYSNYYGRGFGYTRGTYSPTPPAGGGSAFRSGSGSSGGGPSYKSGGGGSFSGGSSSSSGHSGG